MEAATSATGTPSEDALSLRWGGPPSRTSSAPRLLPHGETLAPLLLINAMMTVLLLLLGTMALMLPLAAMVRAMLMLLLYAMWVRALRFLLPIGAMVTVSLLWLALRLRPNACATMQFHARSRSPRMVLLVNLTGTRARVGPRRTMPATHAPPLGLLRR